MFDLPDAKRVRREDIKDALGSGWLHNSDDEGIDEELHAQIGEALGLDFGVLSMPRPPSDKVGTAKKALPVTSPEDAQARIETCADQSQDEDLGEYEFQLFSTAGSKAKVVLRSESEAQGEGGIISRRPPSYYLVPRPTTKLRRQYESAAVSGEDVLARSRRRQWGLELPWKVSHITAIANPAGAASTAGTGAAGGGRRAAGSRRPGKKTRVALRIRDRAMGLAEQKAAEEKMHKEEHAKDKKKRLNRTKKLRRRAKGKEKKKTAADGGGAAGWPEGSDSGDAD